jgi:hypothetical protein
VADNQRIPERRLTRRKLISSLVSLGKPQLTIFEEALSKFKEDLLLENHEHPGFSGVYILVRTLLIGISPEWFRT